MDIEELAMLAKKDKTKSVEILEQFKPLIIKQASKFCISKDLYEDILQEVGILLLKCIDNYDPKKGIKFTTYFINSVKYTLPVVINNEMLMKSSAYIKKRKHKNKEYKYEKSKKEAEKIADIQQQDSFDFEYVMQSRSFETTDFSEELYKIIDEVLNEEEKRIFIEKFIKNKPYEAIASEYGMTKNTVMKKIRKIVEKVKIYIEENY